MLNNNDVTVDDGADELNEEDTDASCVISELNEEDVASSGFLEKNEQAKYSRKKNIIKFAARFGLFLCALYSLLYMLGMWAQEEDILSEEVEHGAVSSVWRVLSKEEKDAFCMPVRERLNAMFAPIGYKNVRDFTFNSVDPQDISGWMNISGKHCPDRLVFTNINCPSDWVNRARGDGSVVVATTLRKLLKNVLDLIGRGYANLDLPTVFFLYPFNHTIMAYFSSAKSNSPFVEKYYGRDYGGGHSSNVCEGSPNVMDDVFHLSMCPMLSTTIIKCIESLDVQSLCCCKKVGIGQ